MKKQQSGFTLIELVVVIVILGILAAVAIPRFADLSGNARIASRDGMLGAIRSATAIARAQSLANGVAGNANATITLEGTPVAVEYGYPSAGTNGIGSALTYEGYSLVGGTFTQNGKNTCTIVYATQGTSAPSITAASDANCQ